MCVYNIYIKKEKNNKWKIREQDYTTKEITEFMPGGDKLDSVYQFSRKMVTGGKKIQI